MNDEPRGDTYRRRGRPLIFRLTATFFVLLVLLGLAGRLYTVIISILHDTGSQR